MSSACQRRRSLRDARPALALEQEWAELHRDELAEDWRRAEREEPLATIDPLP